MKKTEIIQERVERVTAVYCDICGKNCRDSADYNDEFMELKANWGYMSNKDLEEWTAQICEECVDKYFKDLVAFRIYVRTFGLMNPGGVDNRGVDLLAERKEKNSRKGRRKRD